MIQENASNIFRGQAVGLQPRQEPQYNEETMPEDELLQATRPINFNDKIMGGQQAAAFLDGKLPTLGGTLNYTQRVNMLTGKGGSKMEEEFEIQEKLKTLVGSSGNANDKVNAMLGGGTSGSAADKINSILSGSKKNKSKINIDNYLGFGNTKKQDDVISKVLGSSSKKQSTKDISKKTKELFSVPKVNNKVKFDDLTGFGKRAFAGISSQKDIISTFGLGVDNTAHNIKKQKNAALDKISGAFMPLKPLEQQKQVTPLFNMFGNPEKTARKRLKQQQGLTMFGDFDGDKLINMLDCDPLDPKKQGEQHDLNRYLPGGENLPATQQSRDVSQIPQEPNFIMVDDPRKTINMVPDSAEAQQYQMGNQPYDNPGGFTQVNNTFNFADLNRDGDVDSEDKQIFDEFDINQQIKFAQEGLQNAETTRERANFVALLNELNKTKRADEKISFDEKKWDYDKKNKQQEAALKLGLAGRQQDFMEKKYASEQRFAKQKYKDSQEDKAFSQNFTYDQFLYQQQKDVMASEKDKSKQQMSYDLERAKLRIAENKGKLALWESKLKAGSNMLGSLIGGDDSLKGFTKMTGLGSSGSGLSMMASQSGQGANPQNMMMMAGGLSQSLPFENKTQMIVGDQQSDKAWAQKVNESIGNKTPEEIVKDEQISNVQNLAPVQNVQASTQQRQQITVPQQPPQQYQRPQPQQPQFRPQPQQQYYEPDWDEVTPQQAAQYDPQYAKYLRESAGETTYRRGPYKKRQY